MVKYDGNCFKNKSALYPSIHILRKKRFDRKFHYINSCRILIQNGLTIERKAIIKLSNVFTNILIAIFCLMNIAAAQDPALVPPWPNFENGIYVNETPTDHDRNRQGYIFSPLDLNGDGREDIIILNRMDADDEQHVAVRSEFWLNLETGYERSNDPLIVPNGEFEVANGRVLGPGVMSGDRTDYDYNGDGRPDLFFAGWGGHPAGGVGENRPALNGLLLSQSDGTYDDVSRTHLPQFWNKIHWASAGDFDGDGDLDIFLVNHNWDRPDQDVRDPDHYILSYFLVNDGAGRFSASHGNFPLDVPSDDQGRAGWLHSWFSPHISLAHDVNFDGEDDLIFGAGYPTVAERNHNTHAYFLSPLTNVAFNPMPLPDLVGDQVTVRSMAVTDQDGDGLPDIVGTSTVRDSVDTDIDRMFVWRGMADGTLSAVVDRPAQFTGIVSPGYEIQARHLFGSDCHEDLFLRASLDSVAIKNGGNLNYTDYSATGTYIRTRSIVMDWDGDGGQDLFNMEHDVEQAWARSNLWRQQSTPTCHRPPVAAVLPSSRSIQTNSTLTLFSTMINRVDETISNCRVTFASPIAGQFSYQTTDPATNQPTGSPDMPVDIPARSAQTFVLSFTPTEALTAREMRFGFICDNTDGGAPTTRGVNTVSMAVSDSPTADIIAGVRSLEGDTTARFNANNRTVFTAIGVNIGSENTLTVLPVSTGIEGLDLQICESDPATAQCIAERTNSIDVIFANNQTRTFNVYVHNASGEDVRFNPGRNRIRVEFRDGGDDGELRGANSVALRTP